MDIRLRSIVILIFLLVIALAPWLFNWMFTPPVPPAFSETLTAYFPTEWARSTREAQEELQATSVFITLPPARKVLRDFLNQVEPTLTPSGGDSLVPTPAVRTATPEPPLLVLVRLSNEDIQELAQSGLDELVNPRVDITPDEVVITGGVRVLGPFTQGVTVRGVLQVVNEKITIDVRYVERNGRNVTNSEDGRVARGLINNWLLEIQFGQRVQQLIVNDGEILYIALQPRELRARVPYTVINTSVSSIDEAISTLDAGTPEAAETRELFATTTTPSTAVGQVSTAIIIESAAQVATVIIPQRTYPVYTLTPSPVPSSTPTLAPDQPSPTPTPTIPLPIARQSTAVVPPMTFGERLGSLDDQTVGTISGATVVFTSEGILIRGELQGLASQVGIDGLQGEVEIFIRFELRDGQLTAHIDSVRLNGVGISNVAVLSELRNMLGEWLAGRGNLGRLDIRDVFPNPFGR